VRSPELTANPPENHTGVDAPKAERIAHDVIQFDVATMMRDDVEIAGRIRIVAIQRRRDPTAFDRQGAERGFHGSGRPEGVRGERFRSTDRDFVGVRTEDVLNSDLQRIEYRHADSPSFYPIKMPGLGRVGNVVLRKGNLINAARFWDWYKEIKLKKIKADHITVHLMNEEGARKMTWTLNQAWPTKVSDPGELLDGEAGVESMEFAFERLVVDVS